MSKDNLGGARAEARFDILLNAIKEGHYSRPQCVACASEKTNLSASPIGVRLNEIVVTCKDCGFRATLDTRYAFGVTLADRA